MAETKISVHVHTMDGKKWRGDPVGVSAVDLGTVRELLENIKDLTNLRVTVDGDDVYFNPDHIVTAVIEEVSDDE